MAKSTIWIKFVVAKTITFLILPIPPSLLKKQAIPSAVFVSLWLRSLTIDYI
jgi:hypothetical protein